MQNRIDVAGNPEGVARIFAALLASEIGDRVCERLGVLRDAISLDDEMEIVEWLMAGSYEDDPTALTIGTLTDEWLALTEARREEARYNELRRQEFEAATEE